MLEIVIEEPEQWDEKNEIFIESKKHILRLEHSLVSISKWESKWEKPFLSKEDKTVEQTIDYIKMMTLTQNVDSKIYNYLSNENIFEINKYIEAPMTATTFSKDNNQGRSNEIITSELIYYWMIALSIPFECQKWHLNRLLTLIRVCNIKNQPPKQMGKQELMRRNAAINEARRKKLNSKG